MCACVRPAGEMLAVAEQFLEQQMHPTVIISAYRQALEDMLETLKEIRYACFYSEGAAGRRLGDCVCKCCAALNERHLNVQTVKVMCVFTLTDWVMSFPLPCKPI